MQLNACLIWLALTSSNICIFIFNNFNQIYSFSSASRGRGCEGISLGREAQTLLSLATSTNSFGGIPSCSQARQEAYCNLLGVLGLSQVFSQLGIPTLTGTNSDLLPAMQTNLWLRQYKDWTVLSKGPPTQYSPRDTVRWLFQIHKTHVDWLGKLSPVFGFRLTAELLSLVP